MKKNVLSLGVVLTGVAALFSFANIQTGIIGKVNPVDGVEHVYVVSGEDTTRGNFSAGIFSIAAQPGTYKFVLDAKPPYADHILESIEVKDGQPLDLGTIELKQE